MAKLIDLNRYSDWTARLAVFSRDGGRHVRGDVEDLLIVDTEPALAADEIEQFRLGGAVTFHGPRSRSPDDEPNFGLVLEGAATVLVTSQRLIVMAIAGASQLGPVDPAEIHTLVVPWDLVASVAIPARKSIGDRIAGARTIAIFSDIGFASLGINPAKTAEVDGKVVRIRDEQAMRMLVEAGISCRMRVSPSADLERLRAVAGGQFDRADGSLTAWLSPSEGTGIPPHLEGRVVMHDES